MFNKLNSKRPTMRPVPRVAFLILACSLIGNLWLLWTGDASGKLRKGEAASVWPRGSPGAAMPLGEAVSAVDGRDPAKLLTMLRKQGAPGPIVRAVVLAAIDEEFREREDALLPKPKAANWWQPQVSEIGPDEARALLALRREKSVLRESLLGPDPDAEVWESENEIEPERRMQASSIIADYDAVISLLRPSRDRLLTAAEKNLVDSLGQESSALLLAILSPDEIEALRAKKSDPTHLLRQELGGFVASDEEKAGFIQYSEQVAAAMGRESALSVANEGLRSSLGPDRYRELDFNRRPEFRNLADLVQRTGLPPERALGVYDVWNLVDAESQRIRADSRSSLDQKLSDMNQLATSARAQINALLGGEVAAAYLAQAETWLTAVEKGKVVSFTSPYSLSSTPISFPKSR